MWYLHSICLWILNAGKRQYMRINRFEILFRTPLGGKKIKSHSQHCIVSTSFHNSIGCLTVWLNYFHTKIQTKGIAKV